MKIDVNIELKSKINKLETRLGIIERERTLCSRLKEIHTILNSLTHVEDNFPSVTSMMGEHDEMEIA